MSAGNTYLDRDTLTVVPSRRTLMTSLPVLGWALVALAVLLLGGVLASGISFTAGAVTVLTGSLVLAATILVMSRHLTLKRLRPRFTVTGTVLRDDRGRSLDLMDMDGIQTWVAEDHPGDSGSFFFAVIPRGQPTRVDPKAVTAGVIGRQNLSVPEELEPYAFCYSPQLRPRLHVFAAELQRRAPHLFIDHVGYL